MHSWTIIDLRAFQCEEIDISHLLFLVIAIISWFSLFLGKFMTIIWECIVLVELVQLLRGETAVVSNYQLNSFLLFWIKLISFFFVTVSVLLVLRRIKFHLALFLYLYLQLQFLPPTLTETMSHYYHHLYHSMVIFQMSCPKQNKRKRWVKYTHTWSEKTVRNWKEHNYSKRTRKNFEEYTCCSY